MSYPGPMGPLVMSYMLLAKKMICIRLLFHNLRARFIEAFTLGNKVEI